MRTIKLRKSTKKRLDLFANGKSSNEALKDLLSDVDIVEEVIQHKIQEFSNIHVNDELLEKLKKCKKYSNESHSDVIDRILDEKMK